MSEKKRSAEEMEVMNTEQTKVPQFDFIQSVNSSSSSGFIFSDPNIQPQFDLVQPVNPVPSCGFCEPKNKILCTSVTNKSISEIEKIIDNKMNDINKLRIEIHKKESVEYYERRKIEIYNIYKNATFIDTLKRLLDNMHINIWSIQYREQINEITGEKIEYIFGNLSISFNNELHMRFVVTESFNGIKLEDKNNRNHITVSGNDKNTIVNMITNENYNKLYKIAGELEIDYYVIIKILWCFIYKCFMFNPDNYEKVIGCYDMGNYYKNMSRGSTTFGHKFYFANDPFNL